MLNASIDSRQAQSIDRKAIQRYGIPSLILMENAGRGIADLAGKMIRNQKPASLSRRSILVVCGKGNNGGDGLVAARHLFNRGFHTTILLLAKKTDLKEDPRLNFEIARKMRIPVIRIARLTKKMIRKLQFVVKRSDLVIDAIFGVGLTRDVSGVYSDMIYLINRYCKNVLSIDMPSGVNSDTGKICKIAVKAKETGTFTAPKKGLFINEGAKCAGKISVLDVSVPRQLIKTIN